MKIIQKGDKWYHIIEELKCPFNENNNYIILYDNQITYWQNGNNYYHDMKLNIEMMKVFISQVGMDNVRNEERKQKKLLFLRDTLSKMIAYEREIKINEVLDKTNKENLWLYC